MSLLEALVATDRESTRVRNATQWAITYDSLDVASQFKTLRDSWHKERGAASSAKAIVNAASYRRIVFLGEAVLPYIFRDLEYSPEPDYWFAALYDITREDPVKPKDHGDQRAMAKAWLKWGKAQGYEW